MYFRSVPEASGKFSLGFATFCQRNGKLAVSVLVGILIHFLVRSGVACYVAKFGVDPFGSVAKSP